MKLTQIIKEAIPFEGIMLASAVGALMAINSFNYHYEQAHKGKVVQQVVESSPLYVDKDLLISQKDFTSLERMSGITFNDYNPLPIPTISTNYFNVQSQ